MNGEIASGKGTVAIERTPGLVLDLFTSKGRGVRTTTPIPSGSVIETCPILVLEGDDNKPFLESSGLWHYTYKDADGNTKTVQAVVFGLGSLFNHSRLHQNVGWKRDVENKLVRYYALRDIKAGEELCISYGAVLTFQDVDDQSDDEMQDPQQILSMSTDLF